MSYDTFEHNGFTIEIHQDEVALEGGPDQEDEGVFLVAFHSEFSVNRDGLHDPRDVVWYEPKESIAAWLVEDEGEDPVDAADAAESGHIPGYEVFRLEAYIHSGVCLALAGSATAGNFPDRRWDVSQVGYVLVKRSDVGEGKVQEAAEVLVEEWNHYLAGDVWGYVIRDGDGEEIDACWGYCGQESCRAAAKEACPGADKTKECKVRILATDHTWADATVEVPVSMGDRQVPAFLERTRRNTRLAENIASIVLAGGEE